VVQGFTPDGSAVLFTSAREVFTGRYTQLFTVPVTGGFPTRLPIPNANDASYAPDGKTIAYTPLREPFRQWKNYRGGTVSRIWLYDVATHAVEEIPRPEDGCNDAEPTWVGNDKLYFLSDRAGDFNVFVYDRPSRTVTQLTHHKGLEVEHLATGGGSVVYEQAGYLHRLDPASGESRRLVIGVAADLVERRPRYESGANNVRSVSPSPSGARVALGYRGEIVTVPAEKGQPRYLTQTPGAHEREGTWSPDGKHIAYFSDASGEYELHVAPQDGKGEVRRYTLGGSGFYDRLQWSPDSEKISFSDNGWSLYWLDLETEKVTKVASESLYGPLKLLFHDWSPDSRWIAYTLFTPTYIQQVFLYNLEEERSHAVTDGLSDVSSPVFDASGKYLYMLGSTDAGPVRQWFVQSNTDFQMHRAIYLAVLEAGTPSPLAPQSDEETIKDDEDEGKAEEEEAETKEKDGEPEGDGEEDGKTVRVDFEGLHQRILALPLSGAEDYASLAGGDEGKIYYLKRSDGEGPFGSGDGGTLAFYDLEKREETLLMEGLAGFVLTADHKKVLAWTSDGRVYLAGSGGKIDPGKAALQALNQIQVRLDPVQEWAQIFHEVWRINRDYFYDPGMHGADWPAMRERYAQFLPHLTRRADLTRIIQWLGSELSVGHHYVFGGDSRLDAERVPGGLLGADYEIAEGRYRFRKIYGGLNWNEGLRSPLTEPGVEVQPGEYLLAVEGRDLRPPENLHGRFENTAGKAVEITVGPSPDGKDSRTVTVVPVPNEGALRNRDWVEGNLRRVHEATDGRVAYVYVPDTANQGFDYFKRYFFPQADKDAIIVDERFNGGGQIADYYIDLLRRPVHSYWALRYGMDLRTPVAAITGPKVMLIDETAGSGGDMLPWMFRQQEMGTLVGKRTWGGLVGILGFPILMDGGFVTAPNVAIWTEDGFIVENVGVPPDIEVEQWPAEVIQGKDPQLEKAIEVALEELRKNPPQKPARPPYPVRARP
jgi:tricorn protease